MTADGQPGRLGEAGGLASRQVVFGLVGGESPQREGQVCFGEWPGTEGEAEPVETPGNASGSTGGDIERTNGNRTPETADGSQVERRRSTNLVRGACLSRSFGSGETRAAARLPGRGVGADRKVRSDRKVRRGCKATTGRKTGPTGSQGPCRGDAFGRHHAEGRFFAGPAGGERNPERVEEQSETPSGFLASRATAGE